MINSTSELVALTKALKNSKVVANIFLGTKDKCVGCKKTVYPIERVTINGNPYHKCCFKCTYGGCTINSANFVTHEGKLYCKHHHIQLFKEKGNYSQLENELDKNSMTDMGIDA
ncbi:putative transcription factor interactor and regulator LIM family [Lupinus albus]|uniref:Putative transcription factor interactor and regulator LIM family n=1 Tax=Lupinus albus TaxID=3870 RepID=A0A6A4NBJ4_LUPAL|nr:putative transcription factor interactor and regulator LIM family [Lupinus albus]